MARKVEPAQSSARNNFSESFSLIGDAKLKQLYATMLKCRLLDGPFRQLASGEKSNYLSSAGQEAAIVGAAIDLRREDWILPQHWTAIAAVLRGRPLPEILSRLQTNVPGPLPPVADPLGAALQSGNIVPPMASFGAQLNIAVGLALAAQSRQKGQVVMAFCEANAAVSTQIADAIRFAALHRLPLLMLALTISPSTATRPAKPGSARRKTQPASLVFEALASCIPVIPVDHTDVVAMYRVAFESIHKARHNGGPTLIEAAQWPLPAKSHQASNNASSDPLQKMEEYMAGKRLFADRWKQGIVERFQAEAALQIASIQA